MIYSFINILDFSVFSYHVWSTKPNSLPVLSKTFLLLLLLYIEHRFASRNCLFIVFNPLEINNSCTVWLIAFSPKLTCLIRIFHLITLLGEFSVLTAWSFQYRPQALHTGSPLWFRRQRVVCVVWQLAQEVPALRAADCFVEKIKLKKQKTKQNKTRYLW